MNQFQDSFSEEIWRVTYKDHKDTCLSDTFRRVAKDIASVEETEEKRVEWGAKFYDLLSDFKGVAGGRIQANAGTEWEKTTYMNCYVGPLPKHDLDSIEGIYAVLKDQANTLKSEGGWGMDFSWIRPRGGFIHGVGVESPGSIRFMELFDKSSEIVTSGSGKASTNKKAKGKIRKGAMMGTLAVWHPDIVEFITAKQTAGRLTKFNVSVNCTDEFMVKVRRVADIKQAISEGKEAWLLDQYRPDHFSSYKTGQEVVDAYDKWDLVFPDTTHPSYKTEWRGDLPTWKAKGYPVIIHTTVSVSWLWNLIMESTYNRNEPGVLFLDRANYFNPLAYNEKIHSTNPCFTGDTLVLTDIGYKRIDSLIGKNTNVWNGFEWSTVIPRVTAENQEILLVSLSDGSTLKCTPYHSFILKNGSKVEAQNLSVGDKLTRFMLPVIAGTEEMSSPYSRGFYCGDGTRNTREVFLYGAKKDLLPHLAVRTYSEHPSSSEDSRLCVTLAVDELDKNFVPSASFTIVSRLGWLAGLLDSDGCVVEGCGQITSVNREFLLATKLMLTTLGCTGVLSLNKSAELKMMPDGKGGQKEYQTQDLWRLNISASYMQKLVELGLTTYRVKFDYVPSRQASRFVTVVSIVKQEGIEPKVYCFNEPKNHTGVFNGVLTGQCGEQVLAPGGVCCLGTINLTQFVNSTLTGFDLDSLKTYVSYLVRFLDNVNSVSDAPLEEYKHSMTEKRRIGCGVMGWGSALFMLKVRFGSEAAAKLRDEVMSTYARAAYEASIDLAEEKGMFSYCDPQKHAAGPFVQALDLSAEYMAKLLKFGIRNSSLMSQQPNGNTSIEANIVSGGMEPIFMPEYVRTKIETFPPAEIAAVTPKYSEGVFEETEFFKWTKEGGEDILRGVTSSGTVYKIDRNRGLTREVLCEDYGVRFLKARGEWDPKANYAVTTTELTVDDHVNDLKGFARWTDSACSKTCNIPHDYPFDDFKNLYLDVYNTGVIKGFTTYRAGTMTSVLAAKDEANATNEDEEIILEDVKLPDSLPAALKTLRAEGRKWYLTVIQNEAQSRPVAMFVQTNAHEKSITASDAVERLLELATVKGVPAHHIESVTSKMAHDTNATKICRMISLNLRHGVLIKNVVATLEQVDCFAGSFVFHIRKFLASFIKDGEKVADEKCLECGSDKVVYQEGCKICQNCGSSKCG